MSEPRDSEKPGFGRGRGPSTSREGGGCHVSSGHRTAAAGYPKGKRIELRILVATCRLIGEPGARAGIKQMLVAVMDRIGLVLTLEENTDVAGAFSSSAGLAVRGNNIGDAGKVGQKGDGLWIRA